MTTRVVQSERDRAAFVALVNNQKLPFTAKLTKGRDRSLEQNRLQWLWANECAEQLADDTPNAYQAYFKLHHGIPILRAADDDFREVYDRLIRPLEYEDKLRLMESGLFPVSSLLTTAQMGEYLDSIHREMTERGVVLTLPDEGAR